MQRLKYLSQKLRSVPNSLTSRNSCLFFLRGNWNAFFFRRKEEKKCYRFLKGRSKRGLVGCSKKEEKSVPTFYFFCVSSSIEISEGFRGRISSFFFSSIKLTQSWFTARESNRNIWEKGCWNISRKCNMFFLERERNWKQQTKNMSLTCQSWCRSRKFQLERDVEKEGGGVDFQSEFTCSRQARQVIPPPPPVAKYRVTRWIRHRTRFQDQALTENSHIGIKVNQSYTGHVWILARLFSL